MPRSVVMSSRVSQGDRAPGTRRRASLRALVALAALAAALGAAVAGCGGGSSSGTSRRASGSVPPGFVGVTSSAALFESGLNLDREAATMARAGVESLRVPFYWSQMQAYPPSPAASVAVAKGGGPYRVVHGVPTSFATSDRIVEAAARHGISILPVVLGAPGWAARHSGRINSPPAATAPYTGFVRDLVERYGPNGSFWTDHPGVPRRPIRDWQIWNEPDHLLYWSDQPFARDYVRLLRAAHAAVHTADPGARVVLAGFANRSWDLLQQVYAAGGRGAFDVAAIHPYTLEVGNVMRIIRYSRAVMQRNHDSSPLVLTEITWSSALGHTKLKFGYETTEAGQATRLAALIPQIAGVRRQLGIDRFYWETWVSRDRGPNPVAYGGLRQVLPSGVLRDKPALASFRRVVRELEGCAKGADAARCG
jgi:hypothetical protein